MLDKEQQLVLDHLLNKGSCYVTGPPGTGKTEIFNAVGENWNKSAAFLPFTKAARAELADRLPHAEWELDGEIVRVPSHNIVVATLNSFCQREIAEWPGSYEAQLEKFLEKKDKTKYSLVGIDEVQDLRPVHFDVAKAVMEGKLFAAGDPNQTIFTFGDALGYKVFEELEKLGCKKFSLHNDYRSGPEIVSILNALGDEEIVSKGPKTYGRDAIFTRSHVGLLAISERLMREGIPHILRKQSGKDKVILGGGNLFLMVTHACKGLGFDRVYQYDWKLPHKPDVNYQEEYNLMYVSVARASKEFYLVEGNRSTNCWTHLRNTVANQIVSGDLIDILR